MRKLTLRLENERGLVVSETIDANDAERFVNANQFVSDGGIEMLHHRLDVLEKEGPWKLTESAEPNQVFPTKPDFKVDG